MRKGRNQTLKVFCGIDWAEDHHDVALVDNDGELIAKRRITDDTAGFGLLVALLAEVGDSVDAPIPVAIETGRGLLVACLRATGREVFAINPMAVSRYRDRHSVSGKKSDAGDALVLAHILRTDMAAHRALPADSELAQAIAVLARAQQDAVWERTWVPAPVSRTRLVWGSCRGNGGGVKGFELGWGEHFQAGVPSPRVVPGL
ncbi:MAG TPA: IS110 family transposase, partial [Sporichthyaceae bacterium]|nr:IS110 family transposase [Sporichthyaceae bacterium]